MTKIIEIRPDIDQVDIKGQAILFQSGIYAKLPKDIPQTLALSVLDVAGAPAQTARICKPGDTVVVMGGGGKSGILCCWQAKKQVGVNGHVICVDGFKKSINRAMSVGVADEYLVVNATDAVTMYEEIYEATEGEMADVVINVVNIPNTEMASIMAAKMTVSYTSSPWPPALPKRLSELKESARMLPCLSATDIPKPRQRSASDSQRG